MDPKEPNVYFLPHSMSKASLVQQEIAKNNAPPQGSIDGFATNEFEDNQYELDEMLYARHAEIKTIEDLLSQRGTSIPALYNQVYKFISNPSSVSVETFKRMVDTDDTVGSGVDFLTTCLAARIGQYNHKNEEISKFVNKALKEIEGGWHNNMKEMLSAAWAGFSVAEKVWENRQAINAFLIKKIVQMPPGTILFETERTGELTSDGILQYQRNYNPGLMQSGTNFLYGFSTNTYGGRYRPDQWAKLGDAPFPVRTPNLYSYLSIRIPVRKCIHYAFDAQGKFGNPYGRSLLRRAYKYWVLKDAVLQMLATALDRKGTPLTLVYVDPNNTFIDTSKLDSGVNPTSNKEIGIRAQEAVRRAFSNIHNDSTVILPGKKDQFVTVDMQPQTSNATDFIAALDFLNKSIMRALLIPSLVFSSGDGSGSFALGQEHAKTFDKILDGVLDGFKQVLLFQLVEELLAYNFPRSMWEADGLGEFASRELSSDERQKEMECIEKAVSMGAIDVNDLNDLNQIRDLAGFDPRTEPIPKPDVDDELFDEDDPDAKGAKDDKGNVPDKTAKPS